MINNILDITEDRTAHDREVMEVASMLKYFDILGYKRPGI